MKSTPLCFKVFKLTVMLGIAAFFCRITGGYFSVALVALGVHWVITRQYGKALACYAFFPFLVVVNPFIVPKPAVMVWALRLGPLIIGMLLVALAMNRRGEHRLPLGTMLIYLICVALSSCAGWAPKISFLKLINFIFFFLGFWIGTQNLQDFPKETEFVRIFILSLAVLTVFGSICTLPFPAIAYPLDIQMAEVFRKEGAEAAAAYFRSRGSGMTLFAGITFHSQTLGPLLSCLFVLVLADALFIECKVTKLHLLLLAAMPILLFMTRSRTAFLSFVVGSAMVLWYAASRIRMEFVLRARVKNLAKAGCALMLLGLVVAEASNKVVTRWVLKTDDTRYDDRSLTEAVTSTRMGLVELSMEEFRMNPLFGMGFQVNHESRELYGNNAGLVLSAPVEKGLLPLMVLGESGIVGTIAFLVFICSFYATCHRRKYMVTIATFTTFLATNLGEATFFSPGGGGGIEWMLTAVGGFCLDTLILFRNKRDVWYSMS